MTLDFVHKLVVELEESIQVDPFRDKIECTEYAYGLAQKSLSKLRGLMRDHSFSSVDEQILYFKDLKPRIISCLGFLEKRYGYVSFMHQSSCREANTRYWKTELAAVELFLAENERDFSYYYSDDRKLNIRCFTVIANNAADFSMKTYRYQQRKKRDRRNYDFWVGAYLTNRKLEDYLRARVDRLEGKVPRVQKEKAPLQVLWYEKG